MTDKLFEPVSFGRYTLTAKMAVGGMAEIFKAKSFGAHGFEKTLVVKRILPQLAEDQAFVKMFIDEAKVMVRVNHPKVVQVLDFGEVDGQYFIAMEYVQGVDGLALLRMCVQHGFRPTTHIAVHIISEVLDALHFAHTLSSEDNAPLGIIHRDISPSNIFISDQGEVKLGDFGIAKAAIRTAGTDTRNLKGKYGYLSPEVVTGGKVDARSDLFSAGVVLAELLMVRRLFVAKNELEVLLQVRDAKLDRLNKYGKHIPDDLRQILESALARDAKLRYQDAATFRDSLHRYLYDHRRMIRHTDVRRFLRRLQGKDDSVEYETMPTIQPSITPTSPLQQPTPKAPGVRPALPTTEVSPKTDRKAPTAEHAAPPVDAEAETPVVKPLARPQAPTKQVRPASVARPARPASSTSYSAVPRERMQLQPGKSPSSDQLQRIPSALQSERPGSGERPEVARRPKRPSALEQLALADPSTGEEPFIIGRKRKIRVGPPPRPKPVPPEDSGEQVGLSSEAMLDALPELSQASDSAWEQVKPRRLDEVLPLTDLPFPSQEAEQVAASRVKSASLEQISESVDLGGKIATQSVASVLFRLAASEETGLLVLHHLGMVKEIYLVNGDPQFVASNRADELFGQFLVRKRVITEGELSMALAMLPHYKGKLGNAMVALRLMRPVEVLRHLTQQVREKVLDAYRWDDGTFRYYQNTSSKFESAPLGLNAYELIGAGVDGLPHSSLNKRLARHRAHCYVAVSPPPVPPEVFRLGDRPRAAFDLLDGRRTVAQLLERFDDQEQQQAFARMVYLLIETGFAIRQAGE